MRDPTSRGVHGVGVEGEIDEVLFVDGPHGPGGTGSPDCQPTSALPDKALFPFTPTPSSQIGPHSLAPWGFR